MSNCNIERNITEKSIRVHGIDAVRATALFSILMIHCEYSFAAGAVMQPLFDLYPIFSGGVNNFVDIVVWKILKYRFLMIFTFLFGLSFYFQMNNADKRGVDFRKRFCLRLFWLFLFGLLHVSFYQDDVLTLFAVLGFGLVAIWKIPLKFLICLCLLFLLQPLKIVEVLLGEPDLVSSVICKIISFTPFHIAQTTDWSDLALRNISGQWLCRWLYWELPSGRLFATIGMFLLGLIAGKLRVFERSQSELFRITVVGGVIFAISIVLYYSIVHLYLAVGNETLSFTAHYLKWISDECSLFFIAPFLAWLYNLRCLQKILHPVRSIGRCTLTCYITQGIIMTWFFYPWGLGMYGRFDSATLALLGIGLFAMQMCFCTLWLKYFKYGPLEGVWRYLTRLGMNRS